VFICYNIISVVENQFTDTLISRKTQQENSAGKLSRKIASRMRKSKKEREGKGGKRNCPYLRYCAVYYIIKINEWYNYA